MKALLPLALSLLALPVAGQVILTGPGDVPCPSTNPTGLIRQAVCTTPTWCETTGKILPEWIKQRWLGGAAWDVRSGQAGYYSNGYLIYLGVPDPLGCKACKILCVYDWNKNYGQKYGLITALAYMDIGAKAPFLFIATYHPTNGPTIVTSRVIGPCNILVDTACRMGWGKDYAIGGMAADPVSKRLFYTYSNWNAFAGNVLMSAKYTTPCNYDCKYSVPVQPCMGAPVTGAAFDQKSRTVYLTVGKDTQAFPWNGSCGFKAGPCCPAAPCVYHGLTVIKGCPYGQPGTFTLAAKPTYSRFPNCQFSCPYCKSLPGYEGGLPQVGNTSFALNLTGTGISTALYTTYAYLLLNGSGATVSATLNLPCSPVLLYPSPVGGAFMVLGPLTTTGTAVCQGKALAPLPIPCDPALVGAKVSGQWIVTNLYLQPAQTCLEFTQGFVFTL